ncbi:hypothetical protein [Leptospira levettii]|uniref:hypothetical protein n=1 Tax=Leptospira levettii TaxID=2023178 RepID=UPI000C2B37F2|nr:hypothetical protein [Leptospira levettii]PJZ89528.1 hypothetical protein CH368_06105 [Leptospira levettii]
MYIKGKEQYNIHSIRIDKELENIVVEFTELTSKSGKSNLSRKLSIIENQHKLILDPDKTYPKGYNPLDEKTWGEAKAPQYVQDPSYLFWDLFHAEIDNDSGEKVTDKLEQAVFKTLIAMGEIPSGGKYD